MRSSAKERRSSVHSGTICSSSCLAQVSTRCDLPLHLCLYNTICDWHWHSHSATLRHKKIVRQTAFSQLVSLKVQVIWENSTCATIKDLQAGPLLGSECRSTLNAAVCCRYLLCGSRFQLVAGLAPLIESSLQGAILDLASHCHVSGQLSV